MALYGAAGAGFSDYHTTINAPTAFFVSLYQGICLSKCLESVAGIIKNTSLEDLLRDKRNQEYRREKFLKGFSAHGTLQGEYFLANAMAIELLACGVREIGIHAEGRAPRIEYFLAGREFSVFFLQQNLLEFDLGPLRKEGVAIDVYYHRAAMDIPSLYRGAASKLIQSLFDQMPDGGVFATDDICADPDTGYMANCFDDFPLSFDGIPGRLEVEQLPIEILRNLATMRGSSLSDLYGSKLTVRRKVASVPNYFSQ